jgi:hypothetical protein
LDAIAGPIALAFPQIFCWAERIRVEAENQKNRASTQRERDKERQGICCSFCLLKQSRNTEKEVVDTGTQRERERQRECFGLGSGNKRRESW